MINKIHLYDKIKVPYYRLLDKRNNQEKIISQEQFEQMSQDSQFLRAIDKGFIDFVPTRVGSPSKNPPWKSN